MSACIPNVFGSFLKVEQIVGATQVVAVGIIVKSKNLMSLYWPKARNFMKNTSWKNTRGMSSMKLLDGIRIISGKTLWFQLRTVGQ